MCRLLAIALVLGGASRAEAAAAGGMDVQKTLRDWVLRYDEEGVLGLRDRWRYGRPGVLSVEQMAALWEAVIRGPDTEQDGVVRWYFVGPQPWLAVRHDVAVHERTVGKLLRRLGMTRLHPAPRRQPRRPAAARSNSL